MCSPAMKRPVHTDRSFPSSPDAAAAACAFVEAMVAEWGLPEEVGMRMVLAAGEVVDNAAGHGHDYDAARLVRVRLEASVRSAVLVVEQERPGPDLQSFLEADLPADPMDTRGRGLFLVRELADDLWVEDGGRRLVLGWRWV